MSSQFPQKKPTKKSVRNKEHFREFVGTRLHGIFGLKGVPGGNMTGKHRKSY
jgi:hypothetical protein